MIRENHITQEVFTKGGVSYLIPEAQEIQFAVPDLIPETQEVQSAVPDLISETQEIQSAVSANMIEAVQHDMSATPAEAILPVEASLPLWTVLRIAGMVICALFFLITYLRCYREFRMSLPVSNAFAEKWLKEHQIKRGIRIRQSDRISSPLTYGIFRPVILMPKTTDWEDIQRLQYVLQHEYVHIRRFDMIRKLVAALVLCIHWFNPAVWIMYLVYNRDIELSCDERVIREFGESSKPLYAKALIAMEEKRNSLQPLSNSFSKNAIEERIKAVMKTKKVTVWATIISVAVIIIIILVFATSANIAERDEQVSANTTGEDMTLSGDFANDVNNADNNSQIGEDSAEAVYHIEDDDIINMEEAFESYWSVLSELQRENTIEGGYVDNVPIELQDLLIYRNDGINDEKDEYWKEYSVEWGEQITKITEENMEDYPIEGIMHVQDDDYLRDVTDLWVIDIDGDGEDEYFHYVSFGTSAGYSYCFHKNIEGVWSSTMVNISGDGIDILYYKDRYYLFSGRYLTWWNEEVELPWQESDRIGNDPCWNNLWMEHTRVKYTPYEIFSNVQDESIDYLEDISFDSMEIIFNDTEKIDIAPTGWNKSILTNPNLVPIYGWERSYDGEQYLYVLTSADNRRIYLDDWDKQLIILRQTEDGAWEVVKVYYLMTNYNCSLYMANNETQDPATAADPIGTEYTEEIDGISLSEYIEKYVTLTDDTEIEGWEMLNHNGENILRIQVGYNQDDLRGTIQGHKEDYFIFLNGNGEAKYILQVGYEDKYVGMACDYSAHFEDVTFDGNDDLLICLGGSRAQGYCAFIYENGQYRYEKSFENIPDYEVDAQNHVIRGSNLDSATAQTYWTFEYRNGKFVEVEEKTIQYEYRDEKLVEVEYINGVPVRIEEVE
ncbi:MAG: M56 family metallopeptidase [Lachnospiraceae bacterium]|nr:M56 family metallopeptidase [Lachnospiraceae bacterium]